MQPRKIIVTTLMNAPHGVTSISVPVDATSENTAVVKSATGLSVPVYPAPTVYTVVNSQITAADVDIPHLVTSGFIVASQATTAPRKQPVGNPVIDGKWPIY
jgi:hypothetical protein